MKVSYQKCHRGHGHFVEREGCSFQVQECETTWPVGRMAVKEWLEQRIYRWEYEGSKGHIMMGLLVRGLEPILKEIRIHWDICKQENCIMFMLKIQLCWP